MERGRGEASPETLTSSSSDDEDYAKKKPSYSTSARTTSNSIRAIAASTYSAPPRIRNQRENLRIDQDQMGPGGGSITVEDKREVARYIASHNEIEWSNKRQKFIPFHEKWPQRSAAAWAETYRRFSEGKGALPLWTVIFSLTFSYMQKSTPMWPFIEVRLAETYRLSGVLRGKAQYLALSGKRFEFPPAYELPIGMQP
jgi:hypothetical protein